MRPYFLYKGLNLNIKASLGLVFIRNRVSKPLFFIGKMVLPVKNNGFKTICFYRVFEEALRGLIRPLRPL